MELRSEAAAELAGARAQADRLRNLETARGEAESRAAAHAADAEIMRMQVRSVGGVEGQIMCMQVWMHGRCGVWSTQQVWEVWRVEGHTQVLRYEGHTPPTRRSCTCRCGVWEVWEVWRSCACRSGVWVVWRGRAPIRCGGMEGRSSAGRHAIPSTRHAPN